MSPEEVNEGARMQQVTPSRQITPALRRRSGPASSVMSRQAAYAPALASPVRSAIPVRLQAHAEPPKSQHLTFLLGWART